MAMSHIAERIVRFTYTNWRGVKSERRVRPLDLEFKTTPWHPKRQWFIKAIDYDRKRIRYFAMKDMGKWHQ